MENINIDLFIQISGFSEEELKGKSRVAELAIAREILWYCLTVQGQTSVSIGKAFDRKHPTILSGIKTVRNLIDINSDLVAQYKPFINSCKCSLLMK